MANRVFFHGTSMESAMTILNEGFDDCVNTIWSCSDDTKLYLRELKQDSEEDDWCEDPKYLCIESGKIAAAIQGSQSTSIALFRFEMDEEIADEYVEADDSCENMEDCFQIDKSDLEKLISEGKIKCTLLESKDAYIPYMRVFYLTGVINNDYMDIDDDLLYRSVEIVSKTNCYIDELWEFNEPEEYAEYTSSMAPAAAA